MPTVTKIPARLNRTTFTPIDTVTKRKVAAYARVSTDSEEQQTSYAAQVSYYTKYIKSRNDWEFVSVYTDMYPPKMIQFNLSPPGGEGVEKISPP